MNNQNNSNEKSRRPVVLAILDGLGVAPPSKGNAVTSAQTPNLDKYWPMYPHTYLQAAGTNVGLPHGVDGNSEVGHINIGAGKVVYQDLPRIDNAISNGSFMENAAICKAIDLAIEKNTNLHIMGLVGTGGVHASVDHLLNLIKLLESKSFPQNRAFYHLFADGRDSAPKSAADILSTIETEIIKRRVGRIASLVGRYYAMDRDSRWDRIKTAYELITAAKGEAAPNVQAAVKKSYDKKVYDEMMGAYVIPDENGNFHKVEPGDCIIFFNYRSDRAIELTRTFVDPKFDDFPKNYIHDVFFVAMTEYEKGLNENIAFPPEDITNPIGRIISDKGMKQLRIAESEKFPHVTYFFNGGREEVYENEDRIEVPSPKDVATYDLKPEMSSIELTDVLVEKINSQKYDFIVVNYASVDMVAHTGVLDASIKAVEIVDQQIGRVADAVMNVGGALIITADHGNAEELFDIRTGEVDTKHSINPVPLLIIAKDLSPRELTVGMLADVAPTILALMGIEQPHEMTGRNLI